MNFPCKRAAVIRMWCLEAPDYLGGEHSRRLGTDNRDLIIGFVYCIRGLFEVLAGRQNEWTSLMDRVLDEVDDLISILHHS